MKGIQTEVYGGYYCRITFLPHGGKRKRKRWAWRKKKQKGKFRMYKLLDDDGEEINEVLIAFEHEVKEEPAGISLKYCKMTLLEEIT